MLRSVASELSFLLQSPFTAVNKREWDLGGTRLEFCFYTNQCLAAIAAAGSQVLKLSFIVCADNFLCFRTSDRNSKRTSIFLLRWSEGLEEGVHRDDTEEGKTEVGHRQSFPEVI